MQSSQTIVMQKKPYEIAGFKLKKFCIYCVGTYR